MAETTPASHERDLDLFGPEYSQDAPAVWDELRGECPVAHTSLNGGSWIPTTYDDIAAVAYDTERFSSRDVGVANAPEGVTLLVAPPITSDPPFHTDARRMLLPYFSPKAVIGMESATRGIATRLLDALEGVDTADAADAYAKHIPVQVIASMLGLPIEDAEQFTQWAVDILQSGEADFAIRTRATKEVLAYFSDIVAQRRDELSDDLVSDLIRTPMPNGDPLTDKHIAGTGFLLLLAGIDTTWSSIGASLLHLATHANDRERLVSEPELIPTAVEEFLRAYSPVTMARVAATDAEVGGCPVSAGDKVLLPFGAGNRDPERFEKADEVIIDRAENRHFAFGIGIHRCLGSNLARMELQVALEEWLTRFPNFELTEGETAQWAGTQIRGPREIPVTLRP
ncbi:MAG: cytochrome P450 [Acidimicrobiales bacterium]|jgi:cytochrome P450